MKLWLILRLYALERWCERMRERLDPPPEVDWPTVVVDAKEFNEAVIRGMREMAQQCDIRAKSD